MPQPNQIPSHPSAAAAAAGANPVQVHQGAPAGIPSHPDALAQQVQQRVNQPTPSPAPQRNVMQDFFAGAAFDDGGSDDTGDPLTVPTAPPASQPNTDLVDIDDLLSGGEFAQEPVPVPQPQQQTPQPQAVQPQAPAPQPQSSPPAPSAAPSPEQLQTQAIDYLRDNVYRFDDETSRRALTEPEVVLPQLAARLHVNLINEFAQQMHRALPTLIEREVTRRTAVMETKNEFFRRYPKLNRPEWDGVVSDSVAMAAQIHQGQPRDVIMREGAALAAYRLRAQVPRQPPAQGRPQPFIPASPGGGGPVVPTNPQQGANVWAELAADPDLMNF
jgi:hypothetical protein